MEYASIQLCDLSDEILMIIFKKLSNIQILYSLIGSNKRLNKIARDPIFTTNPVLDRFCSQTLPNIHNKIRSLDLESSSMERILLSTNYSNLCGLALYNVKQEAAINLFTDEILLTGTMKNEIISFLIDINTNGIQSYRKNANALIFTRIFTIFNNLNYLCFGPSQMWYQQLSFNEFPTVFSSTLLKLRVNLLDFTDCLYILDGRFHQLHTLYVDINFIMSWNVTTNDTVKVPHLKCFTLYSDRHTEDYDKLIVPLLHRMLNLEKLELCLTIFRDNRFIDGYELKKNIIDHMPRLNKFLFNISSWIPYYNQTDVPSNEDIQYTLRDFKDDQIISSVDYFSKAQEGHCHLYSYLYKLKSYKNITNNFPGGILKCVREVSLFDERPFEHEFFLRISQSFPLMEILIVVNKKSQTNKQCGKSKHDYLDWTLIKYPRLKKLNLIQTHEDYVEQFLVDSKMCLTYGIYLLVNYQSLKNITYDFTRDDTRINCAKLKCLSLSKKPEFSEDLKDYFPHAKIF